MGCVCAANANMDIAKLEAEINDHNAQTAATKKKTAQREIENSVTPEIPSIPKTSIQTNLSQIQLGPIEDGNITPFPKHDTMSEIIDNEDMDDDNGSSYSDKNTNKCMHILNNSGTLSDNNDDDYKVFITLNNNNKIELNITNLYIQKKWFKILEINELNEEAKDIQTMDKYYNKLQNIILNGVVKCIQLDNGYCQIILLANDNSFEFVVPECDI